MVYPPAASRRRGDEEFVLAKRWQEQGDVDAAHRLVTSHLRLVATIAMGYRGYGLPLNEIISEGNVGLMLCRRSSASTPTAASGLRPTRCGGSARLAISSRSSRRVLARQHRRRRAQTVEEPIEARPGTPPSGARSGGLLGVQPVGACSV